MSAFQAKCDNPKCEREGVWRDILGTWAGYQLHNVGRIFCECGHECEVRGVS